jgi:hypothetical protein
MKLVGLNSYVRKKKGVKLIAKASTLTWLWNYNETQDCKIDTVWGRGSCGRGRVNKGDDGEGNG